MRCCVVRADHMEQAQLDTWVDQVGSGVRGGKGRLLDDYKSCRVFCSPIAKAHSELSMEMLIGF